ncbi:MAG: DnaJ like chaperone protein [Thiomicrorhabdus sp.]|nr:MAG: DnaJ like chaperone protein [Thiomicrorhabdus sp.]
MRRLFKFITYTLLAALALVFVAFKLVFKLVRKTADVSSDAYGSVKNSKNFGEAYKNFASNEFSKSRLSIPEEVIALMAKVAKSDGAVSKVEVEFMSDTIKSMLGGMQQAGVPAMIIESTKRKLFTLANRAKNDENSVQYYCQSLSKQAEQVRVGVFMQMVTFASLDGLSDDTLAFINELGETLGFNEAQIKTMIEQVRGGGQAGGYAFDKDPYAELGCTKEDDFRDIKKAYRRLVKQHHPDYMHGQGMDDEEIKKGTEKMQEINAAFEEIKRRKEQ